MSITTKIVFYKDLTPEQREEQPNNGSGKEDALYLKVVMNGETYIYSDAMEPEDARFSRDLSWIESALRDAYNAGFKSGTAAIRRGIS